MEERKREGRRKGGEGKKCFYNLENVDEVCNIKFQIRFKPPCLGMAVHTCDLRTLGNWTGRPQFEPSLGNLAI